MSRTVLVTGASRGIGRAVCRAFAARGDSVVVHYANRRDDAVTTLESLEGSGHVLVHGSLTDPETVRSVVDRAAGLHGGLDVVVNNAAVMTPHPPATVSYAEWQRAWTDTLNVNLVAASNVCYCAAQAMMAAGRGGHIVNIGSRGAFRGEPDHPAYGASKAALLAMSQSLAVALAPHDIVVGAVAPGFVETERVAQRLHGPEGPGIRAQSPFGRVARPEEIASAVVYLASPEATWAAGAILDMNGASHLRL
ncbi:SDR family NAD(P)-dependent oxidoreductase [Nocardia carnea]|uniref:SDR family NAD(P)-dependent oxidoreductase n=1 Tax=Nocardia carnea TaxID=37328 RepID=UPI002454E41C|nr:SDR family oxidoreductase [Nocardia carnea]